MEHPEKALFEEVKCLRSEMNDLRDRIFKLEADYMSSIESLEIRELKYSRLNSKLELFKQSASNSKVINSNGQSIHLASETLESNLYCSPKLKALPSHAEHMLEIDHRYLNGILEILQKGHNCFFLDEEEKAEIKQSLSDEALAKDKTFIVILQEFFESESFGSILMNFNINHESVPNDVSVTGLEIVGNNSGLPSTVSDQQLDPKEAKSLMDINNKKAVFLDYNTSVVLELDKQVRTKTLWVRPYILNTSIFNPSTGQSYTKVQVSRDGKNWKKTITIPSDYGSKPGEFYLSCLTLNNLSTFRFIQFSCDGNSQFSLSYLSFKEPKDKK